LYAPSVFSASGRQYVGARFSDNVTYVLPPSINAGVPARRAKTGDTITLYGVGFGAVVPALPSGQTVQQSNALALPFTISFAQVRATTTYAGLAPGAIGLYQFNVVVPNVPASDAVPVTFTLNGTAGTQVLFTAVQ
jgi:uncharacterized protein (TIGR03437 family)